MSSPLTNTHNVQLTGTKLLQAVTEILEDRIVRLRGRRVEDTTDHARGDHDATVSREY